MKKAMIKFFFATCLMSLFSIGGFAQTTNSATTLAGPGMESEPTFLLPSAVGSSSGSSGSASGSSAASTSNGTGSVVMDSNGQYCATSIALAEQKGLQWCDTTGTTSSSSISATSAGGTASTSTAITVTPTASGSITHP